MKKLIRILMTVLGLTITNLAQGGETFDLATFSAPRGWQKQTGADAVQFSTEDKATGAFCLILLFKSLPGLGSSKENFDAAFETIVKEAVSVSSAPEMEPLENKDGWEILTGAAAFDKEGSKGAAILVTATGYGKMMNVLILTNTGVYEKNIGAFLNSVHLKKPESSTQPQSPVSSNGSHPPLAGNFWKQAGIRGGMLGHSGLSTGTFSKTYQFFGDGTYKFYREDMQLAAPKYYLEHEEGTYTVSGNTLTITSKRSRYSQHRLSKEEPATKSGNLALSTAQYRLEFWLHDGNWALLLSPADGNETKRDGTFSFWRNGEAQRTYQYVLVDANGRLIR